MPSIWQGRPRHAPVSEMPHELIPSEISNDVVEALENLLYGARHGHITGIAFNAILKGGRRYMVDWAGTVDKMPTYALGGVNLLARQLTDLISPRDAEETR